MIVSMQRLVATLGLLAALGANAAELRVLNWQGYGTDESWALEAFSAAHDATVVHDYFNSEQEMLTRLRTNPGVYDVVLINSSYTQQAVSEGLIQALDTDQLSHLSQLDESLRNHPYLSSEGELYGAAWVWGATAYAVNSSTVEPLPTTLAALWEPRFADRLGWRDDAVEAVQLAALALGQDMNNPEDLEAIRQQLLGLKPQIRTFWSSEDQWNKYLAAGQFDAATYWSGSAARSAKAFELPVHFVVPEEGAIGWFDGLSIPTDAPNPELAHAFIDYMIGSDFYVQWDTQVGAPAPANRSAMEALPEDAFNRAVMGDPAVTGRLVFMAPIPDERRNAYLELWQEVKAELAR